MTLKKLAQRLDRRVDKMVDVSLTTSRCSASADRARWQLGLIDEIKDLRKLAVRSYGTEEAIDHQEGIFQSIGTLSRPSFAFLH
jgi:hypothetical protein